MSPLEFLNKQIRELRDQRLLSTEREDKLKDRLKEAESLILRYSDIIKYLQKEKFDSWAFVARDTQRYLDKYKVGK